MQVKTKEDIRERIHRRIRKRMTGTPQRPRLAVFRSQSHIYAQVIDDEAGRTLCAASSLDKELKADAKRGANVASAKKVLVVVGDGGGHVGYGMGKAREVSSAIKKGVEAAKKNIVRVPITEKGSTISHTVTGRFGSGAVLLKPASEGTGVIAGGAVRAVITAAGIQNILTKSLGSTTAHNVVKATVDALLRLKQPERVARLRGKEVAEILEPSGKRPATPAPATPPAEPPVVPPVEV